MLKEFKCFVAAFVDNDLGVQYLSRLRQKGVEGWKRLGLMKKLIGGQSSLLYKIKTVAVNQAKTMFVIRIIANHPTHKEPPPTLQC